MPLPPIDPTHSDDLDIPPGGNMATQVIPVQSTSQGADPAMGACDANGNDVVQAQRGTMIIIQSAGTPANVTIKSQKTPRPADAQFPSQAFPDLVFAQPATAIRVFGPFESAYIKQGGTIEVRYDSVVNLKIGALKIPS